MYPRYKGRFVASIISLLALLLSVGVTLANDNHVSNTSALTFERVSVSSNGGQGNATSGENDVSADGRFVVFRSLADNLVTSDANNLSDIFVRDREARTTELVSVSSSGVQANRDSSNPEITADGRFVTFSSRANNLVTDDTDVHAHIEDVFVRDRQTNQTVRVSLSSAGQQGNAFSHSPTISDDGRFVAFQSTATNLVVSQTSSTDSIYLHDRQTSVTTLVSVSLSGKQARLSQDPHISGTGRFVVFFSDATDLVTSDTNAQTDVFIRDLQANTTSRVSVASDGTQGNGGSYEARVSADGRFVVFTSEASNLVSGDTNGKPDVFIRDRQTNQTSRITTTAINGARYPHISDSGKYVAFTENENISLYDRESNKLVEQILPSAQNTFAFSPAIVTTSGALVLSSAAPLLTEDTNQAEDVYVLQENMPTPTPTATPVTVDSGFRLNEHAWKFENDNANASWDAFKATYGADAVEWKLYSMTLARPNAQRYYEETYATFGKAGVCYGMVSIAALRYANSITLPDSISVNKLYDVPVPFTFLGYWLTNNVTNYIYEYHGKAGAAKQLAEWSAGFNRELSESTRLMRESIDGKMQNPYGLTMYGKDSSGECVGHTVLPFAYSQSGDTVTFSVYDPNHPNETHVVTVNPVANTWAYTSESTLQWSSQDTCNGKDSKLYRDGLFAQSLAFDTSLGEPTWGSISLSAASTTTGSISQLVMGKSVTATVQGGNPVYYIPLGVIPGEKADSPLIYLLDAGVPVSVTLHQLETGESAITLFAPQTTVSIKGRATQGSVDTLTFAANVSMFTLKAGETVSRSITTITGDDIQQHQVDLSGIQLTGSSQANFSVGGNGTITLTVDTNQSGYQAHFLQAGVSGTNEFTLTMPSLATGDSHLLQPNWTESSVLVQTDQDSDGTIDHQETIQSQTTRRVYLPLIKR